MKEEHLLTGELEKTNEPYAIAKIAGIKMCQSYNRQYGTNFIACMPTNLYGPNDNFDLESSHVLPAIIRKFHEAKENKSKKIILWGTGLPKREFLYVDDLADACIFLMKKYNPGKKENEKGEIFLNIGTGKDLSIKELANTVKEAVNYQGEIIYDTSKPDGAPRKLLDVSKINNLGWKYKIGLETGIRKTYEWYKNNSKIQ
jgi:GDP-L-fucose synthase